MADEAEKVIEENVSEESVAEEEVSKEAKETTETEEFEVVLDDEGSQPVGGGYRRMIGRLKASKEDHSETAQQLEAERQRSDLLQLALDQTKNSKAPNPSDFDDGTSDAKYVEAFGAHTQSQIDKGIQEAVAKIPRSEPVNRDLIRRQEEHYERADKLGRSDYEETEDEALSILGQVTVNAIIEESDKSEIILHYFGKNPKRAEVFADLVVSHPRQAMKEIGRLEEKLKVKPLTKTQQAAPDEELEGGTADTDSAFERKLDKLRERAAGGDSSVMGEILALKKKHREKAA